MIPLRFRLIRPYLASLIYSIEERPPLREVLSYVFQPSKEARASRFIESRSADGEYEKIVFKGLPDRPFYYPRKCRWIDLCQTIDECFNPANWHNFFGDHISLTEDDVVVDCGAAEGLFTFVAAGEAKRVYAVEPVPIFIEALERNFANDPRVKICPVAVAHRSALVSMSNDEIFSRVSARGSLEVRVSTVDDLVADDPDRIGMIKADVEGFEFPMLLGAERTIREHRPKIALTTYHAQNNVAEMRDFLSNLHADYRFAVRGIGDYGHPVLLQAW